MKLNKEYFYCFGCGATGDVIDLTARLYNLSPKEAAEKLAQDFGLIYDSQAPPRRNYVRQKTETQQFQEKNKDHTFRVLADYYHLLRKWEAGYTPKTPEEPTAPPFFRGGAAKRLHRLSAGFFSGGQPGGTKAVDCRTSINNRQFGRESENHG